MSHAVSVVIFGFIVCLIILLQDIYCSKKKCPVCKKRSKKVGGSSRFAPDSENPNYSILIRTTFFLCERCNRAFEHQVKGRRYKA